MNKTAPTNEDMYLDAVAVPHGKYAELIAAETKLNIIAAATYKLRRYDYLEFVRGVLGMFENPQPEPELLTAADIGTF